MRACVLVAVLGLALAANTAPAAGLEVELLWTANPDMVMEGAPMTVDLNGDGDAEILTAAYESLIAVDGAGKEIWRFDTAGRYSTCPAVLEREEAPPLIFAGDNTGAFTCVDGEGEVVWETTTKPIFCASPALADLDGDGKVEVIQGDKSGTVNVFDAFTGGLVWKRSVEGECASPAIGDVDGDGAPEIVMATGAGKLYALDGAGEIVWKFDVGGTSPDWATSSPILFSDSTGRTRVAAASRRERFFCLDDQGNLLWERPTRGAVASALSAADFDADGRADVFAVTQLGVLYRFEEDGRALWDIDTQGRSLAAGAIIDLDGDGALEYVLCTQQGNLLVFSNAGEIRFNYQFDNRTINVTPAFGDIVAERPGLEFAITGGESGQVFCFGTAAPVNAPAEWRTYRGDNRLTGAWLGLAGSDRARMMPEHLTWDGVLTGESITFRVENPNPSAEPLTAEAVCLRPDGSRQTALGKVVGRHGLLELPAYVTAPGVYRFAWSLRDASGNALVQGSRELSLQPYVNDQALAKRAVLSLQEGVGEAGEEDGGLRAALERERIELQTEAETLASLRIAAPGATPAFREELDARTAALNARAKRALALADVARSILTTAPKSQVVAFEGATWSNRDVDKQLPSEAVAPLRIERRCVSDEHEPVSVKLLNVTAETITVSCRVDTAPGGPVVTVHEVKPAPTNQGTVAWDPMIPLGSRRMAIPPLETREIWLDIDLAGVQPGVHRVAVAVSTGTWETKVEIVLNALPFEMAGFGAMRLCCWARYNDHAVKDLLAHGNNVFVAGLPAASVQEGDTARVEVDFADLDAFVAPLSSHDVFLLLSGVPSLGTALEAPAYVPRLADYLDQVLARLAAKGIDEDHVAFYPHDEPGGHGWDTVNHFIAFARQALKARPGLKFYVNGGGDLPVFQALDEVAAIWCPGFYMLSQDTPEMGFLRESGKTLWSYDCGYGYARPIGANTKTINVVAQYRLAAPFTFSFGAAGLGFWCYNVGPSMWDAIDDEYPLVYVNADGTHTSCRRWEAVREGMEDARILIALREKLTDPSVGPEVKGRIRRLLEETLGGLARQALEEVHLGVAGYVLDDTNNDATVVRLRAEMLDCVALLAGL